MITLFTGMPGAGKTAALVDLLSGLVGERPLFVDGLNGLTLPHTVIDANNWHTELPEGAILVIDEVQRMWRPRGAGSKVPESVQALEVHRHRGIDIFMTTQSPKLLDSNVRGLIGRHVHIRDTGITGRYWYEWPECNDSMQWKTCVNKKRYKLPKKAFELYKSSSLHTTPIRGIPRALYVGIASLLALFVLGFMAYKVVTRSETPKVPAIEKQATSMQTASASGSSLPASVENRGPIDDRVDFIPRVSGRPESAPAYDHLRKINSMPVVTAGWCQGETCRCFTDQGSDALSGSDCREFVERRRFDYYRLPRAIEPANGAPLGGTPPPGVMPAPAPIGVAMSKI